MEKWIHKENIQIIDKVKDWKEAIQLCGKPLLNSKIINNNYIEKIIKTHNQIGPYYVLAPNIAVPHARPEDGSFDTALSLLIIKNGTYFGKPEYDPVKIIFMLASKNNNSHIHLIASLAELLQIEESINKIKNSSKIEDVYNEIIQL